MGTDLIVVAEPAAGSITYLQLEPRSVNGTPGKVVRATVDPASVSVEIETPTWEIVTESEGATDGTFTVKLYDPDEVMDDVYYRTKSGTAAWTSYAVQDATPTNLDSYTRTVTLVEGHHSFVEFRGRYTVNGVQRTGVIKSSGFDLGTVPNISVSLTTDTVGVLSANVQGDSDTASIKILGSTSGQPTDANTRLETPKDGRMFDTSEIGTLATLDVGDTGYVTAFGYSAASGGGTESTDSVKVRYTRPGRLKPEVQVAEVRSAATSTVTIDVKDRDLRVTAIDFRKRDGADGGASLSAWIVGGNGGGGSGWYAASGTLGSSTTLQRVLNISVADGTEGEFQWRVVYADDTGNAQTFGTPLRLSIYRNLLVQSWFPLVP